ncbi:MAG: hypothetical protein NW207_06870 [Cytophagales bacterium]|nr:hypothetical protein [Cytophagales bacterium]
MKVYIKVLLAVIMLYICSCTPDVKVFKGDYLTVSGLSLVTTPPDSIYFPDAANATIPGTRMHMTHVLQRKDIENISAYKPDTGVLMNQVPQDLLQLITRNNVPYKNITTGATISGWIAKNVNYLYQNGAVENKTNNLTDSMPKALSISIAFFPDGYYVLHNMYDPKYNEWGWYQLVLRGGNPVAIIYQPYEYGTGQKFDQSYAKTRQLIYRETYSFGIWGVEPRRFFPLSALNYNRIFFLTMEPVTYIKN